MLPLHETLSRLIAFRTLSHNTKEHMRALLWIEKQLKTCLRTKIITESGFPSLVATSRANLALPEIRKFEALYRRHNGAALKKVFAHGSSDARFFAEKNIPVIVMHPLCDGHHTEKEWINLKGLENFHRTVKNWLVESC